MLCANKLIILHTVFHLHDIQLVAFIWYNPAPPNTYVSQFSQ